MACGALVAKIIASVEMVRYAIIKVDSVVVRRVGSVKSKYIGQCFVMTVDEDNPSVYDAVSFPLS